MLISKSTICHLFVPIGLAPFKFFWTVFATYTSCFNFKLFDNTGYTFLCSAFSSCISIIFVPSLHHMMFTNPAPCVANTCDASANILICSLIGKSSSVTDSQPFKAISSSLELFTFLLRALSRDMNIFLKRFFIFWYS